MTLVSHAPRKQHLISKVLLRRFASADFDYRLRAYDLKYGRVKLHHPTEVAYRNDFIAHDAATAEARWQEVETDLGAALDAVEAGAALDDDHVQETLCVAIVMHFMRRNLVKDAAEKSVKRMRLRLAVPDGDDRQEVAETLLSWLDEAHPQIFAEQIEDLYRRARELVAGRRVEVVVSPDVPLLIGDAAVLSSDANAGVGFIPFAQAATHLLPVGRHHLIALAKEAQLVELSAGVARQLNEFQILNARRHVFFSPEDDLEEFVSGVRAERLASTNPTPAGDSAP